MGLGGIWKASGASPNESEDGRLGPVVIMHLKN